jgi:hypothetical protein
MGQVSLQRFRAITLLGAVLLLGACETRSISNSGYAGAGGGRGNPFYRGELTEFDVLGIDLERPVGDDDIARSAAAYRRLVARKGSTILLIQSGAIIPDDPMAQALARYFTVIPFSGVPVASHEAAAVRPAPPGDAAQYARGLRLAAAKGGADFILCYWGMLESAIDRQPTKAISWVPVIGSVIPDETQHMRIRLKLAIIDVATGSWSMFAPDAFVDASLSAALNRAGADQGQVEALKAEAYKAAVEALVAKYAG